MARLHCLIMGDILAFGSDRGLKTTIWATRLGFGVGMGLGNFRLQEISDFI